MSVALLIITHAPLGGATLEAATTILGGRPLPVAVLDIPPDTDPQQQLSHAEQLLSELEQGDGVLLLTDLYGSTPGNIATRLLQGGGERLLVCGLSLPMLVRTMNYASLPLRELAQKALGGGRDGILLKPDVAAAE
jgi:PTS system ascorbate-specific IIA component